MSPKLYAITFAALLILAAALPNAHAQYVLQVYALTKNLNKITLISVQNTGKVCVSLLLIKVKHGSIAFVKAKNWERKRIDDSTVQLTSNNALGPKSLLQILLKWNDRPEIPLMKITGGKLSIC